MSWSGRKTGEEFDASESDARLLCAADALGGQKATIIDRSMKAVEPPEPPIEPPPPTEMPTKAEIVEAKRRYMRRDLRAQN
jgi:hypothetical protein